jgi:hypothetical protein
MYWLVYRHYYRAACIGVLTSGGVYVAHKRLHTLDVF